jgi:ribosomal protein S8
MYSSNLNYLITSIVNGYNSNKKIIKIKKSKFIFKILIFLKNEGYINGFYIKNIKSSIFFIELKYKLNGYKFINFFKSFNTLHKKYFISFKKLKRNYKHSYLYVLTTNFGILSGNMAVSKKIGGFILFKLC